MNLKPRIKATASLLVVALLLHADLGAQDLSGLQNSSGKLEGAIEDVHEARVQGAGVEFETKIEGKKLRRKAKSDKDGFYEVELPAGMYQVTVKYPGFCRFRRKGVIVEVGKVARFNVTLEVDPKKALDAVYE